MLANHDQNKCYSCLDSLKVCALYVKLESSGCRSISDFRPSSIDRKIGLIDLAHLKCLGFYIFAPNI